MNRPVVILWVSDRCPVSKGDLPSSYIRLWGFFQEPFLSWWLWKLENDWLVCPEVHPLCLGYRPQQPRLKAINKSHWHCFITQHCPTPDCSLRTLFHPHGLAWPLLHNSSALWFSSSALQHLSRARFLVLLERGSSSPCIKGLLMYSDALGWLQGDPLLPRCLCHMLSFSHSAKPHSPQGLASISSAVVFYSFLW